MALHPGKIEDDGPFQMVTVRVCSAAFCIHLRQNASNGLRVAVDGKSNSLPHRDENVDSGSKKRGGARAGPRASSSVHSWHPAWTAT